MAGRTATVERTFGHRRAEVLAAMLNTLSLWLFAGWIFFEAHGRFRGDGHHHEVEGVFLLIIGAVSIVVYLGAAWVLYGSARNSLNIEGAYRHVLADLIGSIGVVVAGGLIMAFDWEIVDPILSVLIGVLILAGSWGLTVKVYNVLLEGVPDHIDVYALCGAMEDEEGVTLVHDIHVWSVSSNYDQLSAHVLADPSYQGDMNALLRRLREIAHQDFGISHVTIQLEVSTEGCTENDHVDHLMALKRTPAKRFLPL